MMSTTTSSSVGARLAQDIAAAIEALPIAHRIPPEYDEVIPSYQEGIERV